MSSSNGLFIGLMSGTSLDAIDVALIEVRAHQVCLQASHSHPLADHLRAQILSLCAPTEDEINRAGQLHLALGHVFADAVLALLHQEKVASKNIVAIGSHGQTVRHRPDLGFSLQLGSADVIAMRTGITTVADFRNHDMALGGQGAPLVPTFHQALFANAGRKRAIVNIGGMANVSLLDGETLLAGFDTGPGNVLLNHWMQHAQQTPFDRNGMFAAKGQCNATLLERFLQDDFFSRRGPKSTGREKFSALWLERLLTGSELPADVQATLTELTARSIAHALQDFAPDDVFVCGGGAHNLFLMQRLAANLQKATIASTQSVGWHPDWIEAACFAWLAWARLNHIAVTSPAVTGASRAAISGAVYFP